MLGKVMKYDAMSVGRLLLPAVGLALALSAVLRLATWVSPYLPAFFGQALPVLAQGIGGIVIVGLFFLGLFTVVYRFYQSTVGHEGYLTWTLPVRAGHQVLGRLLVAVAALALTFASLLACVYILVPGFSLFGGGGPGEAVLFEFGGQAQGTVQLQDLTGGQTGLVVLGTLLFVLLSFTYSLTQMYTAIGIGGSAGKNPLALSILFYFVINTVESVVALVLIGIPAGIYIGGRGGMVGLIEHFSTLGQAALVREAGGIAALVLALFAAVLLVLIAANHIVTCHCFAKRLNLD